MRRNPNPDALNTGILCNIPTGADVDVPILHCCATIKVRKPSHPDRRATLHLSDQIVALAETMLGITPLVRIDRAPKTLLVYRQAAPFAKVQTPELFVPTDGSETGIKCKVEILAGNLQFVASGIHPDTMEPYRWTGETPATVPLADLPEITEEQAKAFRDAAEAILRAAGGVEKAKPEPSPRPTRPSAPRRARSAPLGDGDAFRQINDAALDDIEAWAGHLFPFAKVSANGAWRISSADLGRDLEEDLSITNTGIQDFGTEEKLTAIDVVMRHGGIPGALDAGSGYVIGYGSIRRVSASAHALACDRPATTAIRNRTTTLTPPMSSRMPIPARRQHLYPPLTSNLVYQKSGRDYQAATPYNTPPRCQLCRSMDRFGGRG